MRAWFAKLLQQPKAYRRQAAFLGATGLTSIIVLVWLVSLPQRYSLEQVTEQKMVPDATADAQSFFEGVRDQVANVREAFSELQQAGVPVVEEATLPTDVTSTSSVSTFVASTSLATTTTITAPVLSPETLQAVRPARPIQIATTSAVTP